MTFASQGRKGIEGAWFVAISSISIQNSTIPYTNIAITIIDAIGNISLESNIMNVALPEPKTRVVVPFGVAYGSDLEKVGMKIKKRVSIANESVIGISIVQKPDKRAA